MEDKFKNNGGDDSTKYGEFISSFDRWLTFEEQKNRTNHLENNTKNSKQE